jgi:hypothetical protein
MSDVQQRLIERKKGEAHKQRNAARFMWHEKLVRRHKSCGLTLTAVCLAGLMMHDRDVAKQGYVALSLKDAAKELGVSKRGIINARDLLVAAGWLEQEAFRGQRKAHYKLTIPDPAKVHARSPRKVHARSPHPSSGTSGKHLEVVSEKKKGFCQVERKGAKFFKLMTGVI